MNTTDPKSPHYMTPGAKEAFDKYRRNAVVGFLLLLVGLGFALYQNQSFNTDARDDIEQKSIQSDNAIVQSGRTVSVAGCNRDFRTIRRLRRLIAQGHEDIDKFVAEDTLSPAQGQRAHERIRQQIEDYRLPDCREAAKIVTSNPREVTDGIVPLYPRRDRTK